MVNIASAIRNTVPISLFNRGLAGKIFDEVKQSGAKVVMKNNAAECVLLSPEEYMNLIDEVNCFSDFFEELFGHLSVWQRRTLRRLSRQNISTMSLVSRRMLWTRLVR